MFKSIRGAFRCSLCINSVHRVKWRPDSVSPPGGSVDLCLYPLHVFNHAGVNAVHPLTPTLLRPPPGHQPKHHPPPADPVLHDKRPPAVPQAGVPPPLEEAGAEHVFGDVVADGARGVAGLTLVLRNYRQLHVLQEVRGQRGGRGRGRRGRVKVGDPPPGNYTQRVGRWSRRVPLKNTQTGHR